MGADPRFAIAADRQRIFDALVELAEYARSLETEIDGLTNDPDEATSWGGVALVKADAVIADFPHLEKKTDGS